LRVFGSDLYLFDFLERGVFMTAPKESGNTDQKRDEVLKRMLNTPPKLHAPLKGGNADKNKEKEGQKVMATALHPAQPVDIHNKS
jgi:hypothetical protein